MPRSFAPSFVLTALALAALLSPGKASANTTLVVSVPEQKIALVQDGEVVDKWRVSTSRFGLGDSCGSYATPLGRFKIADKVGQGLPIGAVMKGRRPTGEVLKPNAKGRDPIVTRILHLKGQEKQNARAYSRGIYIHGTAAERTIGKPDSFGCVRMRSKDVVKLFDRVPVGATVFIVNEKLKKSPEFYAATHPNTPAPTAAPAAVASAKKSIFPLPDLGAVASVGKGIFSRSASKPAVEAIGPTATQPGDQKHTASQGFTLGKLLF